MIVEKYIVVKPNNHSIEHYLNKGYDAKCRKEILIKIEDLSLSSTVYIHSRCDICGEIKKIKYQDYNKCLKKYNFYVCCNCKFEKAKITKKEKYGDEKYFNFDKYKETMNLIYGCTVPLQNDNLKKKKEKTCTEKYGFKNASENNQVKEKISESSKKLFNDPESKKEIIEKRINTCIEKYGVTNYCKTDDYKIKSEKTTIRRYGYKHNGSVPEFILKRQETKRKNNKTKKSDYHLYKRQVINVTRPYLKELFEKWNGYDYYDKEFIKDNFSLKPNCSLYPSVDHKIPTFYGFKNNIPPEIIGNIDNLCITKKSINSAKRDKIYENDLLKKLKIIK